MSPSLLWSIPWFALLVVALVGSALVLGLFRLLASHEARLTTKAILMLPMVLLASLGLALVVLAAVIGVMKLRQEGRFEARVRFSPQVVHEEHDAGRPVEIPSAAELAAAKGTRSSVPHPSGLARIFHAVHTAFLSAARSALTQGAEAVESWAVRAWSGSEATEPEAADAIVSTSSPPSASRPASSPSSPPKRPHWVDNPPQPSPDTYEVAINSEPWKTRLECERALADKIDLAVDDYVAWRLGEKARSFVRLPHSYVRHNVIQEQWLEKVHSSVGDMLNLHALLRFDSQTDKAIEEQWHQLLVTGRIVGSAAILGALVALLTVIYGYLKIDLATGGVYRWRLRLAAGALIAAVAAGMAALWANTL